MAVFAQEEMLRLRLSVVQCEDNVFAVRADAEFGAPDAEAAAHIIIGFPFPERAESIFIDGISDPRDWPYLSVVGMP